jgi:hypothetical protein
MFAAFFYERYVFFLPVVISSTGSNTKLVIIATKSVSDVSQPNACVPPKPEKQKIIKPATNTNEV